MRRYLITAVWGLVTLMGVATLVAQDGRREVLASDTPRTTAAGVTFTAPQGWGLTSKGNLIVLDAPEADSRVAIVDVEAQQSDGQSADAAVAAAWKAYRPDGKPRPLKLAVPGAPRNGWEERRTYEYETSPNEKAIVFALASRAGTHWTVAIIDASQATFEKRGGQFSLVGQSLRPKGYQRESFAGKKAHPLTAERIAVLKAFVEKGMHELDVPGVGLSFIDGGRVVFEGGLGVKELGKADKVDAETLFIAASNTKGLTTFLLAKLADEKKLRWDQPVTQLYPAFKLGDAQTTSQVLVKHLICACTGLPRQDLEWIFEYKDATPKSTLEVLGTMQPTSAFGGLFQYSNLMAAAAGFIGGELAAPNRELGAAYDEAMRTKVFEPLGMKHTTFDFAQAQRGNHASPHASDVDGKTVVARMDLNYAIVPARPAGGVWTSAHDLSRYVQLELANGKLPDGSQYVSPQNLLARRAPQVQVSEDVMYGMGLIVDTQYGIPVVHHGGDLAGYHSDMIWMPEHGVGAVILTNSDPGYAIRGPLLRRMLEVMFDGKPEAEARLAAAVQDIKTSRAKARERLVVPADAAESAKLAKRYANPALGDLAVSPRGANLVFDFGEWSSVVASRKNDDGSISYLTIDPSLDGFEFVAGEQGGKRALTIRDAQHEYPFTEVAK